MADQPRNPLGAAALNTGMGAIMKASKQLEAKLDEERASVQASIYVAELMKASTAEQFCTRLQEQIKRFDEELDQDHEAGVKLVTFGQAITFHVAALGFHNPSLIFFYGETASGDKVQLIQHVNQISFVLMAMPKPDPDQPKRPFGFAQAHEPIDEGATG